VLVRILDGVDTETVEAVTHAAGHVSEVHEVTDVFARWIGHRLHAELSVSVSPALSVAEAHGVAKEVRHRLLHEVAHLGSVTVHVDPLGEGGASHHRIVEHTHDGLPSHAHPKASRAPAKGDSGLEPSQRMLASRWRSGRLRAMSPPRIGRGSWARPRPRRGRTSGGREGVDHGDPREAFDPWWRCSAPPAPAAAPGRATSAWRKQSVVWSLTRPADCMKA
jgi:hypothetical protein